MNKKILVTGTTGYIGSHLVKVLLQKDCFLRILARDLNKVPQYLKQVENVEIFKSDLANTNLLKYAVEDIDVVFHLAAESRMFEKGKLLHRTNILGLRNILEACKLQKKKIQFLFSSSIEAVGPISCPKASFQSTPRPLSDYGISKLMGEKLLIDFCRIHKNVTYTIVRIGNVYGGDRGIIKAIETMLNRGGWRASILFHTLREYTLHLIHLDDLVNMLVRIIDNQNTKNKIYYLVNQSLSINEIAKWLKQRGALKDEPRRLIFDKQFLLLWNLLARVLKAGNLLTYISLGGEKRKFRNYNFEETINVLGYAPKIAIKKND